LSDLGPDLTTASAVVSRIDYAALPPGRHELLVHAAERPGGSALTLPVTVLVGRRPRPRLAVVAGVHGNEFPGPLAVGRLGRALRPEALDGTVVLVPIANPLAFDAGTRVSPEDGVNLNRVFPGSAAGSLTLRLAWALVHGVIQDADLALDLHSADGNGVMLPMGGFRAPPSGGGGPARRVAAASARAAAAFGLEMYWLMAWAPGTLSTALNELGVPAVGAEVGGAGQASEGEVGLYEQAVRRCLAYLGIAGDAAPVRVPTESGTMEDVAAPTSGLLELAVGLRDEVAAGAPIGRVVDVWGAPRAEIAAPFAGRVVHARTFRQVRAGETVVSLSRRVPNPVAE
jgi:predicted deacylase